MSRRAAVGAVGRFYVGVTFVPRQGKELFTRPARPNLEVGRAFGIDIGGQQQLERIVSDDRAVRELDDGQPVVEDFERRLLPFSIEQMTDDEHRLSLTLDPQVP